MKIAISGHTSGLGKSIFDKLKSNYSIDGFSRQFNESDITITNEFIEKIKDYDVFINNAYSNDAQSKLFESLFIKWKDENKIIINILNSLSLLTKETYNNEYFYNKQMFLKTIQKILLNYPNKSCKIINIFPGTLDTNTKTKDKLRNRVKSTDVADLIQYVLNLPEDIEITFISIRNTKTY